jgi:alpha-amylase/alpha-mannosidase (GH57 family)
MFEPLHIAFVWHMHQPYYRSARTGDFEMPWARLHALKDYLDMVETLSAYPSLHMTFNLVPSLVEQLGDYAGGRFVDVYWEHTLKSAADLSPAERAFVLERMCERSDHPRTRSHPRYLELAMKKEAHAIQGWEAGAGTFSIDELRDLQVWFNLAWFDPRALETSPLRELVTKGRNFREEDKQVLAQVQADILARTLPAYRDAARRRQVELSTSPYFHPILPLLANTDSARIAASDTILPPRRFAHPEDAAGQIMSALAKHESIFGEPPRGMWCSELAVGEDVLPLLIAAGLSWTISDETVLARSLSGAAGPGPRTLTPHSLYAPYQLARDAGEISMVFRDHTLSDLIGFAYQSWPSRDAAADLIQRLRDIRTSLRSTSPAPAATTAPPLVTIALDGENAWEYYPRDGRDFLQYLYEGLSAEPSLRCVTISEHLRESPPTRWLEWLHTGSWIGGDLRTWSGDRAHNTAWDLLHRARDLAAGPRRPPPGRAPAKIEPMHDFRTEAAWHHIMIAQGSDWLWWFGDHHHTDLDHLWDLHFRLHLQEVYRRLGLPIPLDLFRPILEQAPSSRPVLPQGALAPVIDGLTTNAAEWEKAGFLVPDLPSAMQRSVSTSIDAVRFGWQADSLCLLVAPRSHPALLGLEIEVRLTGSKERDGLVIRLTLEEQGRVEVSCTQCSHLLGAIEAAWNDVLEVRLPLDVSAILATGGMGLVVHIGRGGMIEHVFHSAGLDSLGWGGG